MKQDTVIIKDDNAEEIIDDRFSVRVSPLVEKEDEDQFCVEIWLNE